MAPFRHCTHVVGELATDPRKGNASDHKKFVRNLPDA